MRLTKWQSWLSIRFTLGIILMKCHYDWNIGLTLELFSMTCHYCRNSDFTLEFLAMPCHNIAEIWRVNGENDDSLHFLKLCDDSAICYHEKRTIVWPLWIKAKIKSILWELQSIFIFFPHFYYSLVWLSRNGRAREKNYDGPLFWEILDDGAIY